MVETHKIGRAGERKLEQLCDDANLLVSQLTPDVSGKDRIVEFPLEPFDKKNSYDSRLPPLEFRIQIKTTTTSANRFTMKLSNAERLCRDSKPCFVFVARLADGKVAEMYLVHLWDGFISKVLRRLRMAQATESKNINQIEISISFTAADLMRDDSAHLKSLLENCVVENMFKYAEVKAKMLQDLGYPEDRYRLKLEFESLSQDDFLDGILGLKPLPIKALAAFGKRFDVELPEPENGSSGTITIEPQSKEDCLIRIWDDKSNLEATLAGRATFAAVGSRQEDKKKILIETSNLSFLIRNDGMNILPSKSNSKKTSIKELHSIYIAWKLLKIGGCNIDIIINGSAVGSHITLNLNELSSEEIRNIESVTNLIENAICIKSFDGFDDADVDVNHLIQGAHAIRYIASRIRNPKDTKALFDVSGEGASSFDLPEKEAIEIQAVVIGDELFAFASKSKASIFRKGIETKIEMKSEKILACEKILEPYIENYSCFRQRLARISDIRLVLQREVGESTE